MKKRKLFLFIASLVGLNSVVVGQETTIESGQRAENYLAGKNLSVDHATGIFHYKIPVHALRAGDFVLPVSLDYAAKGVKADDAPGPVGFNWNLNVGGVVMRTLRGGIADEEENGASRGSARYVGSVLVREADGESDIFTAVFNGRSVDFILYYQKGNTPAMVAIPLEPTNVKIQCMYYPPNTIAGWNITDESGNLYTFGQHEITTTTREGTVETNAMIEEVYSSSWYLSSIKPANGPSIYFSYFRDVSPSTWYGDSIVYYYRYGRTAVKYFYGQPIIERPFDFNKYKDEFDQELRSIGLYFDLQGYPEHASMNYYEQLQMNYLYAAMDDYYQGEGYYSNIVGRIAENLKTMGMLYDREDVNEACQRIMNVLNQVAFECQTRPLTDYTRALALQHIQNAKQILIDCKNETQEVHNHEIYQHSTMEVRTPMLKSITTLGQSIDFQYSNDYSSYFVLERVVVRDANHDVIKSVHLNRPPYGYLPEEIAFHDKVGNKVSNVLLEYYGLMNPSVVNMLGYYMEYTGLPTDPDYVNNTRFFSGYNNGTLYRSLKTIKVSSHAEIGLVYESNACHVKLNDNDDEAEEGDYTQLGIRLSELQVKDLYTGWTETTSYDYHDSGTYIYPRVTNRLQINYPKGFHDLLYFDRLYNPYPDAYVKLGNNGVYYTCVSEITTGRGRVDYHFCSPVLTDSTYNYWEVGEPLGICYYNDKGDLRKVTRYEYDDEIADGYKQLIFNFKPCEYFVNEQELRQRYEDSLYFEDNLQDRLNPIIEEDLDYLIIANYDTYLKRVAEYYFEGDQPAWSESDYLKTSDCYTITEFDYNLSASTFPVRRTVQTSDGRTTVEVIKRALDFTDSVDYSIPLLKERNMVALPLKTQQWVKQSPSDSTLVMEQVNLYRRRVQGSVSSMLPFVSLTCYPATAVASAPVEGLLTFGMDSYDADSVDYAYLNNVWQPLSVKHNGDNTETRFDGPCGHAVLTTANVPAAAVAAKDYNHLKTTATRAPLVLSAPPSLRYRLFVVCHSSVSQSLSMTIETASATSSRTFTVRPNDRGPQVFDIDLSASPGIVEVTVSPGSSAVEFLALVPAEAVFEASGYNADGTLHFTFNQNGLMTRHEYDNAGRLVRTYDQEGNILQEKSYNIVLQ